MVGDRRFDVEGARASGVLAEQWHHEHGIERLRDDVIAFGRNRDLPAPERRKDGSYAYPELRLR